MKIEYFENKHDTIISDFTDKQGYYSDVTFWPKRFRMDDFIMVTDQLFLSRGSGINSVFFYIKGGNIYHRGTGGNSKATLKKLKRIAILSYNEAVRKLKEKGEENVCN